jgi:hypothetical protein
VRVGHRQAPNYLIEMQKSQLNKLAFLHLQFVEISPFFFQLACFSAIFTHQLTNSPTHQLTNSLVALRLPHFVLALVLLLNPAHN